MGETVLQGHLFDRWRVRVGDALVFAESIAARWRDRGASGASCAVGEGVAIASVIKIPGDEFGAAAVRDIAEDFVGEVGVSAWDDLLVARLVAPDGAALHRDLVGVLTALNVMPLPRLMVELAHDPEK